MFFITSGLPMIHGIRQFMNLGNLELEHSMGLTSWTRLDWTRLDWTRLDWIRLDWIRLD